MKKSLSLILTWTILIGLLSQFTLPARAAEADSEANLIDVGNPTNANSAIWSYTAGVWTMTNSNYANLRYDIKLNKLDEVQFSFDAAIISGNVNATIRTLDNQFLATNTVTQDGTVVLRYTILESGVYRFQICGVNDTSCAQISNITVKRINTGKMEEYEQEAERVTTYVEAENADLALLLFADNHSYERLKYQKYQSIMSHDVIDYQIGLGDYVDYSHSPKSIATKQVSDCITHAGKEFNCFYVYGNHDVGICGVNAGSDSLDVVMTPEENYTIYGAHLADNANIVKDVNNPKGGYYYVDDENSKIRMIVLNTSDIFQEEGGVFSYIRYQSTLCVSQMQLTWFAETALSFADKEHPSDWSVIVFGHEYNPYGGDLILFEILNAVQKGKELNKTTTVYQRLADNGDGTYGPEVDTINGDTYYVDVDYSAQGPITVMGFIHGHNHVDTHSVLCGINRIQVRCDNGDLDQYHIAKCEARLKGNYYFKDKNGHIYTFKCNSIPNAASIGYNNYWTSAKMTPAPISVFDENGIRLTSVSCKYSETIPEDAVEITGFVAERDGSSVGKESCEVLCIDKDAQTLTFVPYGTGTLRVISYEPATSHPVIIRQPENTEATLGENYCVTVEAEGEGLTYRWYFRNSGTTEFIESSVTTNTYSKVLTKDQIGCALYCVITDNNGNSVTTDTVALNCAHSYTAINIPPTCTEQGYTTYTCACGDSYVDDWRDPLGHNFVNDVCHGCGDVRQSYVQGDHDRDGDVDVNDVLTLLWHVLFPDEYPLS